MALANLGIVRDGAVLILDGVIDQVGPTSRLENVAAARGAMEIDATGKVVMPGLVDCHTHMVFPPPQIGEGDPADLEHASRTLVATTAQRLAKRGRVYLKTMARHGTTTLEAKSGCGPNQSADLKVLRALQSLNQGPLDIVPTFLFRLGTPGGAPPDLAATERSMQEFLAKIRRRLLARFADLEWDTDMSRRPLLLRFLEMARTLGFACKIHAERHSCGGAVSLAVERRVTSIDHLEYATLEHARMLAGKKTIATLLPSASFRHGHHAPARMLIDSGVAVALGSNFNPQECPSLNMQTAIALASLQMGMTPAEAIQAATINAAYALCAGDSLGSLEEGKMADVIILNASDHRDLAYQFGTNLVHTTIKRGQVICNLPE